MGFDMGWLSPITFWLVLAVICIIAEGLSLGLTTIWFAAGAVVALVAALFDVSLPIQIVLFFVVSVALLLGTRRLFVKRLATGAEKTNVDALIGQEAVTLTELTPFAVGQIKLNGQTWSAVCRDADAHIAEGTVVKVVEIEGVKAIVTPIREEKGV